MNMNMCMQRFNLLCRFAFLPLQPNLDNQREGIAK